MRPLTRTLLTLYVPGSLVDLDHHTAAAEVHRGASFSVLPEILTEMYSSLRDNKNR